MLFAVSEFLHTNLNQHSVVFFFFVSTQKKNVSSKPCHDSFFFTQNCQERESSFFVIFQSSNQTVFLSHFLKSSKIFLFSLIYFFFMSFKYNFFWHFPGLLLVQINYSKFKKIFNSVQKSLSWFPSFKICARLVRPGFSDF